MSGSLTVEGALAAVHGQVVDVDSHELIPVCLWPEVFGEVGRFLAPLENKLAGVAVGDATQPNSPSIECWVDEVPVSEDAVWRTRPRVRAPGAIDMARRPEVLDLMGVRRQLVFPGFGLVGVAARRRPVEELATFLDRDVEDFDLDQVGRDVAAAHNRWAVAQVQPEDRLRPVAILAASDVAGLVEQAEALFAAGIRAVWLPSAMPPGGRSPAHPDLEPFWRLCEEADAAVLNHLGGDFGFYDAPAWRDGVELFEGAVTLETRLDPYSFATTSIAPAHFVLTMVLGGVFERHPGLRFGAIECGAHWIGPLAENLDMWAERGSTTRTGLSCRPSEYIQRNVRVTPFHFEPVDRYLERHQLDQVYCFSTDYPHVEGGAQPRQDFAARLAPLGEEAVRRFFVENGSLLAPDRRP